MMVADGAKNIDSGEWWTWLFPGAGDPPRRARVQLDRRRPAQPLPVGMSASAPSSPSTGLTVSFPGLRDERDRCSTASPSRSAAGDGGARRRERLGQERHRARHRRSRRPPPPESTAGGLLDGEDLIAMPDDELRAYRGSRVGMIFQSPRSSLNPLVKAGDQIARVVRLRRRVEPARTRARPRRRADALGGDRRPGAARYHAYPHQLSGGMAQRVMIAMALAVRARAADRRRADHGARRDDPEADLRPARRSAASATRCRCC